MKLWKGTGVGKCALINRCGPATRTVNVARLWYMCLGIRGVPIREVAERVRSPIMRKSLPEQRSVVLTVEGASQFEGEYP